MKKKKCHSTSLAGGWMSVASGATVDCFFFDLDLVVYFWCTDMDAYMDTVLLEVTYCLSANRRIS